MSCTVSCAAETPTETKLAMIITMMMLIIIMMEMIVLDYLVNCPVFAAVNFASNKLPSSCL